MISHVTTHLAEGRALLLSLFRDKRNVEAILGAWLEQVQQLDDVFYALLVERWLQNAVGAQLDVLGRIVGQPRGPRNDATYRLWVAARAMVNRSSGLTEEIIAIVKKLVGADVGVALIEEYPAAFTAEALDPIDATAGVEIAKILRLAKAAGIRVLFEWHRSTDTYTFSDDGSDVEGDTVRGLGFGQLAAVSDGRAMGWDDPVGEGEGSMVFDVDGNPLVVFLGG